MAELNVYEDGFEESKNSFNNPYPSNPEKKEKKGQSLCDYVNSVLTPPESKNWKDYPEIDIKVGETYFPPDKITKNNWEENYPIPDKEEWWIKEFDEKYDISGIKYLKKRWCKFSAEAEQIGYKEERDGVILGETRKGEWRVKWGANQQPYIYDKELIEELQPLQDIKQFISKLLSQAQSEHNQDCGREELIKEIATIKRWVKTFRWGVEEPQDEYVIRDRDLQSIITNQ